MNIYCREGKEKCRPNDYYFLRKLVSPSYRFEINIKMDAQRKGQFQEFNFEIFKGNVKIANILIGLRLTFFFISVVMSGLYIYHFYQSAKSQRTFEHYGIFLLSISLIIFNDPFYNRILKTPSKFFGAVGSFFVTQFLMINIYFWLVISARMKNLDLGQESLHLYNTKRVRVVIGLGMFFIGVPVALYNASHDMHPGYWDSHKSATVFDVFFVLASIYTIVTFVVLFV